MKQSSWFQLELAALCVLVSCKSFMFMQESVGNFKAKEDVETNE
jgi:hypothetical protein